MKAYLGIEYFLVRTEFFAMDSCNSGQKNRVQFFSYIELFIYHICVDIDNISILYRFYMDPFGSFNSCSSRMMKNYHVRFLRGMDL